MRLQDLVVGLSTNVSYSSVLAMHFKSTTAAMFFNYFVRWTGYQKDPDGWIYKTQQEIYQDIGLSKGQQQRARKILREINILEEKAERLKHLHYYRINLDNFLKWWDEITGKIVPDFDDTEEPENDRARQGSSSETIENSRRDHRIPSTGNTIYPRIYNNNNLTYNTSSFSSLDSSEENAKNISSDKTKEKEKKEIIKLKEVDLLLTGWKLLTNLKQTLATKHRKSLEQIEAAEAEFRRYHEKHKTGSCNFDKLFEGWCERSQWKSCDSKESESVVEDIKTHLDLLAPEIKPIMKEVSERIGEPTYISWISRCKIVLEGKILHIKTTSGTIFNHLKEYYLRELQEVAKSFDLECRLNDFQWA